MIRSDVTELHYITPIANLASIMQRGLLSHRRAQAHAHQTVALEDVQNIRAKKRVPGGRPLHEYVNLYFCARNPMLYKRLGQRHQLCVVSVTPEVLDRPGVVVTDVNAASGYARFGSGAAGLALVDKALTFAEYWTDSNPVEYYRKSGAKCAEALVPDQIEPGAIQRVYVCRDDVGDAVRDVVAGLTVQVNQPLFFNKG